MPETNADKRKADRTRAPQKIQQRIQESEKKQSQIDAEKSKWKIDYDINRA